ncbi:MAG: polyprenyl synthetase family protein [Legionellaceae bacterium]|nr:polyprenyl synthetase family protein [Legionellaceae bacterium]
MSIESICTLVKTDLDDLQTCIHSNLQSDIPLFETLALHIIDAGGKRLRPMLVFLVAHACGYTGKDHIDLAAMIECFHTATLLHDDVVDNSDLRRNKPTAHTVWGNKISIISGDYLLTQAFQFLIKSKHHRVFSLMSETAHKITSGELKQLSHQQGNFPNLTEYLDIIESKTAILFAASAAIGPIVANAAPETERALHQYGLQIGMTFQIIDDILDYTSTNDVLGKECGDDLAEGKVTLPLLYALESASPAERQFIVDCLKQKDRRALPDILNILESTNALNRARHDAEKAYNTAIESLNVLPPSIYREALVSLATFALERTY